MAWPTTRNPRTHFVTTRFSDDEAADLDYLAQTKGKSRSVIVREAVRRLAATERKKAERAKAQQAKESA